MSRCLPPSNATIAPVVVGVGAFMRTALFAGVALAAIATGAARAADMTPYPAAPAPAPKMPTMVYDWTGFYLGGHLGSDWTKTDSTTVNTANGAADGSGSASRSNVRGGGQVGFDYMVPARVLIGFVASASTGDDVTTSFANAAGTNVHSEASKTVVSGSVRARLGYALASVLFYGTGGWAWTNGTATRSQVVGKTGNAIPGTIEQAAVSLNGWTAGGGLAYGFWHNWEVFGEYRYTSYHANTAAFPIAQRSTTSTTIVSSIVGGLNFKFDPFIPRY
jgi:outer membrane immunogenic protein